MIFYVYIQQILILPIYVYLIEYCRHESTCKAGIAPSAAELPTCARCRQDDWSWGSELFWKHEDPAQPDGNMHKIIQDLAWKGRQDKEIYSDKHERWKTSEKD